MSLTSFKFWVYGLNAQNIYLSHGFRSSRARFLHLFMFIGYPSIHACARSIELDPRVPIMKVVHNSEPIVMVLLYAHTPCSPIYNAFIP